MTRKDTTVNITPAPPTALASQGTYPANGSTFVAPLPEDAYFDTNPGRMRLSHDGNHWTSQFQRALCAILRDQLVDGPLTVYVSSKGTDTDMRRVSGMLTNIDTNGNLMFEDGFTISVNDVLDIEF